MKICFRIIVSILILLLPETFTSVVKASVFLPIFSRMQALRPPSPKSIDLEEGLKHYKTLAPQSATKNRQSFSEELPITILPAIQDTLPLVMFISGDGGWTSFDNSIGLELAKKGLPVIGLDAQKYFWVRKTPAQAATDISTLVSHYMQQWKRKSFVLIGFSFGACVTPFIANQLPASLKKDLRVMYIISPQETGDFEIHLSDMVNFSNSKGSYNVVSEIKESKEVKTVCFFGRDEPESVRKKFITSGFDVILLPGNHHYNNNYSGLAVCITDNLNKK